MDSSFHFHQRRGHLCRRRCQSDPPLRLFRFSHFPLAAQIQSLRFQRFLRGPFRLRKFLRSLLLLSRLRQTRLSPLLPPKSSSFSRPSLVHNFPRSEGEPFPSAHLRSSPSPLPLSLVPITHIFCMLSLLLLFPLSCRGHLTKKTALEVRYTTTAHRQRDKVVLSV